MWREGKPAAAADLHLTHFGDLTVAKALDVAQHQHLAERRRQCRDYRAESLGIGLCAMSTASGECTAPLFVLAEPEARQELTRSCDCAPTRSGSGWLNDYP